MANTVLQPIEILSAIYVGILIGIIYDVFRFFRYIFASNIFDALFDIMFYVITLFITAISFFYINNGIFRLYILAGLLVGVLIYIKYTSKLILNTFKFIGNLLVHNKR